MSWHIPETWSPITLVKSFTIFFLKQKKKKGGGDMGRPLEIHKNSMENTFKYKYSLIEKKNFSTFQCYF